MFFSFAGLACAQTNLPLGWSDSDIGAPGVAGSASDTNGGWIVSGSGYDIWSTNDQFNFASEPVNCDGTLIALVTSLENPTGPTSGFSKAGVMLRNDNTDGAANAFMFVTATQGVAYQYRLTEGGGTYIIQIFGINAPVWVKTVRSGDQFSGYYSVDGTNWLQVGDTITIEMGGTALAGLAVTAQNNGALNTATFTNVTFAGPPFGVYRELWTNLDSSIDTLDALTNVANNPDWPDNPAAAYTHIFTNFETETDDGMNYFGQRVRTFVVPPTNGLYTFWIASDDSSQLYLSPDESPADMVPIASVPNWTEPEEWDSFTNQQSATIYLQGGCRYYMEAQMQQGDGGGGGNLSVRWQLPDYTFEEPMTSVSEAGTLLIPCTGVDTPPGIFTQSSNLTVVENQPAIFSVLVTNQSPASYQWFNAGGALAGAILPVYTITNASLALNNGQTYTCVISNSAGSITNTPITLTVLPDVTPPTVAEVFNFGPTNVEIIFSEPIAATNAINAANYTFTNGTAIISAVLATNNSTVMLTTAPLAYGSNYTLAISNITDLASTPNTIASNTTVSFSAASFATQDIGSPAIASTNAITANGVNISSAGNYIGGYSDQFNFEYQLQNGDFDVSVCLAGLDLSDLWAQAGLMARSSLDTASPFAAMLATPGMNGEFFAYRVDTNISAATAGNFPVNYPNTWLRLTRSGDVFTGLGSYDGTNWVQLGGAKIVMPDPIYLGLAVASHNTNQLATAQFVNYEITPTNATVVPVPPPHEPLGPSSRKTGIVFSEIMYKPAPRTDGNNVEFLEIYNSNPYFQDISSYQVTCADMSYTFPTNTLIPGGAFFVLAASPQGIANVYGLTSNVFGPYTGSLKKSETLELLDEQGSVLLTVPYSATYPWPVAAYATGHSIVLANPSYGEGDPRAWNISDTAGGSPGSTDAFTPSPLRNVVINEILPHSENPALPQFIELYNHSTNSVDVSGCILTDDPATNEFVIPSGTVIGPAGFVSFPQSQFGFTLNGAGETLYFIKPDGTRVLDAVQFGAQADGVSYGRWPDGANDFYAFTTNTPGTNNSAILIGDIVINELMYDPISENDDDQYIELYNKGTNTVDLSGWQFTSGVSFTFPTNTLMAPNAYLVVARNVTNLFANYTNLNNGNTVGNYTGKLSHDGELVALAMPQTLYSTNLIYVEEDQVTYGTGGRWGRWSGAGGSSLELIDPHANHRLAANWADSDETQKSQWVDIEYTGVLDNGSNYDASIDYAQMGLLDVGECLVDNIEVDYNGSNYVSNGTFEGGAGLCNWSLQGCLSCSSLESNGYQSDYSLHLRCSDKLWTGDNSCQVSLANTNLQPGQTATLRFKARWLRGWPEVLLRLNGNWLEATAAMPVPANLGSPGGPNSQSVSNAGPAMYNVTHTPSVPSALQPVVVTANVHDPDGVQNLTLYYRLDPATNYTSVAMNDNGTGGDAIAGDGVYSATIPGQIANQVVAFYICATDSLGAATRFPAILPDNTPVPECVVLFGDGVPGGSFSALHLWITQTNLTRWANLGDLSRDWNNDCTFVNNSRVIYNMHGRYSGSPFHQYYDTPVSNLCSYEWKFNEDDTFLGATDYKKIQPPSSDPASDASLQRSQLAFTFDRALGVPWLYKRYVVVYANGNRRGSLMEDSQVPNSDVVKEHFPNDDDGFLYKMQPWFEMAPFLSGATISFDNQSWCNLMPYTTTGGEKKTARYRWNFEIRRSPNSNSNFTNVFSLVDAASSYGTPDYVANMENMANMENWMRVFAANHAAGCWDSFGAVNGQNIYGYIGTQGTKYTLLMWELQTVFGDGVSWTPGQNLFSVNGQDPDLQNIFNTPAFLRMYWRALQELVNGPLNVANSGPLLDAKYNAFTDNGLTVEAPETYIKPWLSEAQVSIAAELAQVNAANFSIDPGVSLSNNLAYITGQAPVNVAVVWVNGVPYPLTWTSLTDWLIEVPLAPGTNQLVVQGVDIHGQPIAGDNGSIMATNASPSPTPVGQVVINEIMYNPSAPAGQYVELYNNSTNFTFVLSGWQLQGAGYTFPAGSEIAPQGFLVLAANQATFAALYGATTPVFDTFPGTLQPSQLLALLDSGSNTIAEVQYENVPPWPAGPNSGAALELIDPTQDNWREGNWAGVSLSPSTTNTVFASLPPFAPLWINEVQPLNLNGITNSAGQHAPWLELYNPTTNSVALTGLYLANSYDNLTNWVFPDGSSIAPGQFLVVFADGQTNLSTLSELHAGFVLSAGSGSLALSQLYNGQPQVLDYLDYTNLPPNYSYGSYPDGQSFSRQQFYFASPGASNNAVGAFVVPYLALGSIYTQSFDALPDPGATAINTGNPVTINGVTYSPASPLNFGASVTSGGLGLSATMTGWYGLAASGMKLGASAGDQSTGGIISFGTTDINSTNRALGLLATSSTGATAFGLSLINLTTNTIDEITLAFTGELWRQQPAAKSLSFSYYIDPTGTNAFTVASTTPLPALNVNFPVGSFSPEDGTQATNQIELSVTNQPILDWPPGAVLWLVWQMTNDAGNSQGLAVDNLSFSADSGPVPPIITSQPQSQVDFNGGTATLSVAAVGDSSLDYQWQFNGTNIANATNSNLVLSGLTAGNGGTYDVLVSDATGTNQSQPITLTVSSHTFLAFTNIGMIYTQDFDSLPNPGLVTVDAANPVTLDAATYALANPVDFGAPIQSTGTNGGLGLANSMPGWFGLAATEMKLGASAGDQSTGGIISFAPTNSAATNRALGLLSTSSTGATTFGLNLLNQTTNTINEMSVSFVGELWRQQPAPKTLLFSYYVDLSGTNAFSTNFTVALAALDMAFLTGGFTPLDGTQPANQIYLSVSNEPIVSWPPGATLWLIWQMTNDAGSSQGMAIDDFVFSANSTLVPPTITLQPQNQRVSTGNNPTLTVGAASAFPVSYQWQFNGTNLFAATNSILTLTDVTTDDQGPYDVIVSNAYGAVLSSEAILTVNLVDGPPSLDSQPQSQTDYIGGTAVFTVTASGLPPLAYQWQFNGSNIANATDACLVLSNLNTGAQGIYNVMVTNSQGATNSQDASLAVVALPPSIQMQPLSQTVAPGTMAVFTVNATGMAPLNYQWLLGGNPLSDNINYIGSATSMLTVSNVQSAETGAYSVMISNAGGSIVSDTVTLALATPSYFAYTNIGAIYTQDFDSLPDPGAVTVSAANPVTINGVTYALANPVDFGYPVEPNNGGLGLAETMPGWYASASAAMKIGASAGDQSTGGLISFGPTDNLSTNRSLGLITTGASGSMAFGLRLLNQTGVVLTNINLSFTGELWREQTSAKTIAVSYYVDPTGTSGFSPGLITGVFTNLQMSFATGSSANGPGGPLMTSTLGVTNQPIAICPPGTALWLIWQMTNTTSSSQGLGIDNLSFSASGASPPSLTIVQSNNFAVISWPAWAAGYTLQYNPDPGLPSPWAALTNSTLTNSETITTSVQLTNTAQYFRLRY